VARFDDVLVQHDERERALRGRRGVEPRFLGLDVRVGGALVEHELDALPGLRDRLPADEGARFGRQLLERAGRDLLAAPPDAVRVGRGAEPIVRPSAGTDHGDPALAREAARAPASGGNCSSARAATCSRRRLALYGSSAVRSASFTRPSGSITATAPCAWRSPGPKTFGAAHTITMLMTGTARRPRMNALD